MRQPRSANSACPLPGPWQEARLHARQVSIIGENACGTRAEASDGHEHPAHPVSLPGDRQVCATVSRRNPLKRVRRDTTSVTYRSTASSTRFTALIDRATVPATGGGPDKSATVKSTSYRSMTCSRTIPSMSVRSADPGEQRSRDVAGRAQQRRPPRTAERTSREPSRPASAIQVREQVADRSRWRRPPRQKTDRWPASVSSAESLGCE